MDAKKNLMQEFGALEIQMFASGLSIELVAYFLWFVDPGFTKIDAIFTDNVYLFPP